MGARRARVRARTPPAAHALALARRRLRTRGPPSNRPYTPASRAIRVPASWGQSPSQSPQRRFAPHGASCALLLLQAAPPSQGCRHPHLNPPTPRSAFRENDHVKSTGLGATLRARNISSVYVVGLALDYCVAWTARDAVAEGFSSTVIAGAAAPVTKAGGAQEIAKLRNDGVRVMTQWPFSPSLID